MLALSRVLNALVWFVIIDVVLRWVQSPGDMPRALTAKVTEPVYEPLRVVLDPRSMGGLDLAPLVVLIVLQIGEYFARRAGRRQQQG